LVRAELGAGKFESHASSFDLRFLTHAILPCHFSSEAEGIKSV